MAYGDMRDTSREAERREYQYTLAQRDKEIERLKKVGKEMLKYLKAYNAAYTVTEFKEWQQELKEG